MRAWSVLVVPKLGTGPNFRQTSCRKLGPVPNFGTTQSLVLVLVALASLGCVATAQQADPKSLFLAGTASFNAGDYASAERQFQACLSALGDNPVVDYNLALTYVRLEAPGRARVYVERGLVLAPRDRAAREQLRLLLARLNETEPPPPSWLHALWAALCGSLTAGDAVVLTAVSNLLAALVVGLWLLSGRRWLGRLGIALALVAVLTWPVLGSRLARELGGRRAVVVTQSMALRGGPGNEFGEIARLTEGQVVITLERPHLRFGPDLSLSIVRNERGLWCEVRAPSGARGYVRRGLIEPV
ncbi:MAG: hypothetical protein FJX75_05975 [Armatimonadetes bacterium]|nr:hypothetical protein [Armatimonadota bacterium]